MARGVRQAYTEPVGEGDAVDRVQMINSSGGVSSFDIQSEATPGSAPIPAKALALAVEDENGVMQRVTGNSAGYLNIALAAGLLAPLVGSPVDADGTALTFLDFDINATSDGDNSIISATASQKIWVLGLYFKCSAAGAVTFKTGSTVRKRFTADAAGAGMQWNGEYPFLVCATNEAFQINCAAGVDVLGGGIAVKVAD